MVKCKLHGTLEEINIDYNTGKPKISFLINEMINLERVSNDGELIKLKEPSTKRKDRYSSLGYAVYISKQLELKLKPKNNNKIDISSLFRFNMQKIS